MSAQNQLPIPVDHPLFIDLANSRAEDRASERTANLERLLLGGQRKFELLPPDWQVVVLKEMAALILKGIRDNVAECPACSDLGEWACSCEDYDRAIDCLTDSGQAHYTYLYFQDAEALAELWEMLATVGSPSFY